LAEKTAGEKGEQAFGINTSVCRPSPQEPGNRKGPTDVEGFVIRVKPAPRKGDGQLEYREGEIFFAGGKESRPGWGGESKPSKGKAAALFI